MPRLKTSTVLIAFIALLVTVTASASDFWLSKDWKQWSKADCESLLLESPWSHVWRYRAQPHDPNLPPAAGDQLYFSIQLRSSAPVREAMVRQLQLDQKYDKMGGEQRNAFDAKAAPILGRSYDDLILVHVDYSHSDGNASLRAAVHNWISHGDLDASLVTEDGSPVTPIRVDISPIPNYAFDMIFPRAKAGAALVKDGQKQFSVQFQSPTISYFEGLQIAPRRVKVDFDLSKMGFDGKLSY